MNKTKIVKNLRQKYPRANIVFNDSLSPTEIICEVDPPLKHPDYSIAIAVINKSIPHYHNKTKEEYEILEGKLVLIVEGTKRSLNKGDKYIVMPGQVHSAKGEETLVQVTSKPGWTIRDHKNYFFGKYKNPRDRNPLVSFFWNSKDKSHSAVSTRMARIVFGKRFIGSYWQLRAILRRIACNLKKDLTSFFGRLK